MEYTDIEQRILDMWPKFEDGNYVQLGDKAVANSGENAGKEFIVRNIYFENGHGKLRSSVSDGCYWNWKSADTCVKRPAPKVLDADGVEIKAGDTVWAKYPPDTPKDRVVKAIVEAVDGYTVKVRSEYLTGLEFVETVHCSLLTHNEPDSWERLERDADNDPCGYFGFQSEKCNGCPAFNNDKPCTYAVCTDIVRRAKALAEKEAGR